MPAAQREITNREVRFTVRFGTTITIAARPVPASSVAWGPPHAAPEPNQARDRASRNGCGHSEVDGAADTEFASDVTPGAGRQRTTDACERSMMKRGKTWRRTPDASAIGALQGNDGIPEGRTRSRRERGRRRTRQDQISFRALNPGVKLRVVKDTRTERRKACFFCRTGLRKRASFEGTLFAKYDPAV
jgi:hypothetical protein